MVKRRRERKGRHEGEEGKGAKKKRNKDYIIIDIKQHWGK